MESNEPAKTPDFLMEEVEPVEKDSLVQLKKLVDLYKEYELDIKAKGEALAIVNEKFNKISREEIPNLVAEFGLSEIKLASGEKVIVKEDANVTITNESRFFLFLKNRKEDDIIKLIYDFSNDLKEEQRGELDDFLIENEYEYQATMGVHHATSKKYFKDFFGIGAKDKKEGIASGKYKKLQDKPEWVNIFVLKKTKIKE